MVTAALPMGTENNYKQLQRWDEYINKNLTELPRNVQMPFLIDDLLSPFLLFYDT